MCQLGFVSQRIYGESDLHFWKSEGQIGKGHGHDMGKYGQIQCLGHNSIQIGNK